MRRFLTFILVLAIAVVALAGCDLINQIIPGGCTEHVDENGDRVCDKCGDSIGSSHIHSWAGANCTSPRTCSICGATQGEALGHAVEGLDGKDATCTSTGLTEGKKCSVCGEILEAQEEIPMKAHTFGEDGKCICGAVNGDIPSMDEITVADIRLSGTKGTLAFGEELNFDGLEVWAEMKDGSEQLLPSTAYTVACEDFNSMKPGTYKVNVKLNGGNISADYEVSVAPADRLKVLMIGNSFADDTINYAYEIAKNSGIPVENILIADIYIGGCSLATHWSNAQSNAAAYRFGLEGEGWFDGSSYTNWTMEQAIKYADWDFITFQQNSGNSGGLKSYSCLQNLMDYVYDVATDTVNNPNANPNVKFVWHQTWAYQQDSTSSAFATYNNDQMTMYNAILSCLQLEVLTKDFVAVIPNGTAIQNARTSFIGDTFSRDQHNHLSYGAGRYIAAMGLVGTLTGRDMSKITWKPTDSGFNYNLTAEEILVCKESYLNASANFLEITPSEYPDESDIRVIFKAEFEGNGTKTSPFLIQTADDMWKLSELTRGKSLTDTTIYFKLTADIDLGTDSWIPICSSADKGWVSTANSFDANFDGNGKTVTFTGNYTGDTWAKGLFSAIGGHVHDLTLRGDINIEKGRVGSLASMAMAGARIENITSYVNITAGNNQVGGIVGYCNVDGVEFINCENYGKITARELVGGILGGGFKNTKFTNCANHGEVTATSKNVGGITGEKYASATLTNCSNDGVVSCAGTVATTDVGADPTYVGLLIGHQY